jgi:gas vesicle protein
MADGYDRFDNDAGGGGSFVMGLLTGTVLGAGLGMLFAPKAGSELRNQVAEQAGNLANTASEGYRRASETAGGWAEKGRGAYDKARDAVARGADEAQRYVRDTTSGAGPTGPTAAAGAGTTGGSTGTSGGYGSDSMRGGGAEQIRGSQGTGTHTGGSQGGGQSTPGGSRRS